MRRNLSAAHIIILIITSIFIFEGFIMLLLGNLPRLSITKVVLLDATILSLLIFPLLYFFVYQPLVYRIREKNQVMKEELKKQAALVKNDPAPVLQIKYNGEIIRINPAAKEIFGRNLTGESLFNLFSGVDKEVINNITEITIYQTEQNIGGKTFLFAIRKDASTDLFCIYGSDITKRKQAEKSLRETEKLAATGRMAARVAHEINNPLAGIKNSFTLIKDAVSSDYPYYNYVARIEKEIDRVAYIVRQMYTLYNQNKRITQEFSLNDAIEDVIAMLESSCKEHEVKITVVASDDSINMSVPENQIRQVLYNVLQNAIEASPPGEEVKINLEMTDSELYLKISDQGHGIPEELHSRIFEPFFTTKSELKDIGLGLGLSISKGIAESMKGSLKFKNNLNQGTIFEFILPLTKN